MKQQKFQAIHTSDRRKGDRLWLLLGGKKIPVCRTGEVFYVHPLFCKPLRINNRRRDVPAVLLSHINQLLRQQAANDPIWGILE